MLFELIKDKNELRLRGKYRQKAASALGLTEKSLENLIAGNPEVLFPKEEILIIGQSISGQSMADVLALDSMGNLLVIEIKRDWSDRSTVAQLLEYASDWHENVTYERLDAQAQRYTKWPGGALIERFREFSDQLEYAPAKLGRQQRVFVVAPQSDEGLQRIVTWLKSYGVPIEFLPFNLYADEDDQLRVIEIEGAESAIDPAAGPDEWAGHWIFNTNETHAKGAYKRIFQKGVIAIYGYKTGSANLEGSAQGQRVFAYVNGNGLLALGEILDPTVVAGTGVFLDEHGNQQPEEYHVKVKWEITLPEAKAISNAEATGIGYSLPVRTVFGRLHRGRLARQLEAMMRERNKQGA